LAIAVSFADSPVFLTADFHLVGDSSINAGWAIILTWTRFVPESPRWLVSKDRHEEAFEILVKYHAEGNRDDPFVLAEFQQIRETIRLELESSKTRWVELLMSPANRRRALCAACVGLFSQWSGNGLVS
jgi:hypothetical protein